MSLKQKYIKVAQDFIDRVLPNEDGSFEYDGCTYQENEMEQLVTDVSNAVDHEAEAYMSHESVVEFSQEFWKDFSF